MHFLADESCDFAVVRALRAEKHDVLAISGVHCGAEDQYVMELARREERILLTEDKDFGRLVYFAEAPKVGVILLRFPATARGELCNAVVKLVRQHKGKLKGSFVVVEPGRIRIRRLP